MNCQALCIEKKSSRLVNEIFRARYIYIMLLPAIAYYIIFCYIPMYGITLAFKEYRADLGILRSPWIGFGNYEVLFKDHNFYRALFNTIVISLQRILFQFPVPIILALMLNEIRSKRYKRVLQTIFTFPNFLSWVIVSGIIINFLNSKGALNGIIQQLGGEPITFLADSNIFRPILYITANWKDAGWNSIIYLAAIAGIALEQYESAVIDGATRFQQIIFITIPSIKSTIIIMLILAIGGIMNAGFDQIFNMYNPTVYNVSDILDTYIYRLSFGDEASGGVDFAFSTAIGLFTSVINFIFLFIADRVSKMAGESGLIG